MITVSGLSFAYEDGLRILDDLTLSVPRGSVLCLAGPNGQGKSTLLSLLAGLLTPSSGSLSVGDAVSPGAEKALRARCGLLLQEADLQVLGATVGEDLMLGFRPGDEAAESAARKLAVRFGLEAHWDSPVQHLSFGQKRKLCLAASLLRGPEVLLLDEPFSGLDYPAAREMRALIADGKRQGFTQIVSTHDLEPVIDLADAVAVLHGGRLVLDGPPAEVLPSVREYGVRPPCGWSGDGEIPEWS